MVTGIMAAENPLLPMGGSMVTSAALPIAFRTTPWVSTFPIENTGAIPLKDAEAAMKALMVSTTNSFPAGTAGKSVQEDESPAQHNWANGLRPGASTSWFGTGVE